MINTTAPTQMLDVVKALGDGFTRMKTDDVDSDSGFIAQNDAQTWKIYNKAGYSDALVFEDVNASVQAMTIKKSTGNVGIGTTNPSYPLHVSGTVYSSSNISNMVVGTSGQQMEAGNSALTTLRFDSDAYRIFAGGAGGAGEIVHITETGSVGIGTTAPGYTLDVSGTLRVTGTAYTNGGYTTWTAASDMRLKDIHGSYDRGLDDVLGIKIIKFQYKADNKMGLDSSKEFVGVTAQNLQTAIPEAVTQETSGQLKGYLTINTTPVLWTVINALKQLYKVVMERFAAHDRQIASIVESKADKVEIEDLKKDNVELKQKAAKVDKLEAENEALKAYLCSKDPAAPICK